MAITSVTFTLNGETHTLQYDTESGQYKASFPAPSQTSWYQPGREYWGYLEATGVDDFDTVTTDYGSATVRVLETGIPFISVIEPDEWRFNTDGVPQIQWVVGDAGSGVNTEAVTLKIDGVPVSGIRNERITNQEYIFNWSGIVEEGRHTALFEAQDNDGNVAESVSISFVVVILITDRTMADAARVITLSEKIKAGEATTDEISEWMSNPKGAYNAVDLNRVGYACEYLRDVLAEYGIPIKGYVDLRTDWVNGEIPSKEAMATYLSTVAAVRDAYSVQQEIPETMDALNIIGANNIERALLIAYNVYMLGKSSRIYAGEVYAGEV